MLRSNLRQGIVAELFISEPDRGRPPFSRGNWEALGNRTNSFNQHFLNMNNRARRFIHLYACLCVAKTAGAQTGSLDRRFHNKIIKGIENLWKRNFHERKSCWEKKI